MEWLNDVVNWLIILLVNVYIIGGFKFDMVLELYDFFCFFLRLVVKYNEYNLL